MIMIGLWGSYADAFLYVAGVAMLLTFGIPLLVVPLRWARVFRWDVPKPENLVVFLGRSVGIFISLMAVFAFKAASQPLVRPFFFDWMLWLFIAMIALHTYGAVRKTQPVTETLEIIVWVVLFLITLCFYP
jgi:hypothetical protein